MNREILFRGKKIVNSEWVEGYYNLFEIGSDSIPIIIPFQKLAKARMSDVFMYQVALSTVGQYTGLTDKNGVKIFEGDIVHYQYEPGEGYWNSDQKSVIEWESTGFYMEGIMGTNKYALSCGWLESIPHNDGGFFEVIGNIHDNPEMLGGEENGQN